MERHKNTYYIFRKWLLELLKLESSDSLTLREIMQCWMTY